MRSRVPCLVARIHGVSHPRDCQPERSTNHSAAAIVSRPRGRPASRGEEVAALPRLKSPIAEVIAVLPRLESLTAEATAILPHLNLPQNDHSGEIAQGSNRPSLPAHCSVKKEHERKQSTDTRESCHFALGEVPKGEASSPHRKPLDFARDFAKIWTFQGLVRWE
ncbi:hypothetical protein B296_00026889 [Ensete ventricosum]|uniref:Uncharacterized protein n=1 Tax=Ensete ventricosum TaxID=4639 RepID=A0A426X662_ENSVE|nr:hypothetical protein B296_00026889 [Ensete ventricosum]